MLQDTGPAGSMSSANVEPEPGRTDGSPVVSALPKNGTIFRLHLQLMDRILWSGFLFFWTSSSEVLA
ncbi:hypothetical protein GWI33_007299 [Rhynchophorus ferrugineus]|uniref:Uncharacterized protein n=1 Tax=Rhynchophorus ferrugineus TaxID=354439 RepID=A0A834IK41_RHYFE|nr:hypothetical protein GWI33_007299 [Rhynchophorus ferrugineus]